MNSTQQGWRKHIAAVSLVAAGVAGGGILASQVAANAAESTTSTTTSSSTSSYGSQGSADQSQPQRSDEKLLTGSDATEAEAAALAEYPGATIERVETDSDGVYEAHIVTAAGDRVTVLLDDSFAVTGTQTGGGGPGGSAPSGEASADD